MRYIQKRLVVKKMLVAIAGLLIILGINSCAQKISFLTSSVVPAAEGTVKVKTDDNNNYEIKISLSHLADPERLQPSKKMYVVWMESDRDIARNIGRINSSRGFLSGKLKASFETVSSGKPNKIVITAEDDASVQFPGTQVVLSTKNF